MNHVAANLSDIHERVGRACDRAGRRADDVTLVAVSKFQPIERIRAAYDAGHRDFGENYAQALRDRAEGLASLDGLRWHAIGPLQRNKAKYVAKVAFAFHALDRADIAAELGRRREGEPIRTYLEVNVAGEVSKTGVAPDAVERLYDEVRGVAGLTIVGLMCMPPMTSNPEDARPYFRALRELAERVGLPRLSMGTSEDFEVAIEEGATDVRVGRAIFGERDE